MNFEFTHSITESVNMKPFNVPSSNAYAASALLLGRKFMSTQADIRALGCIIYEILSGKKPFHMKSSVGPSEATANIARTLGDLPENRALIPFDQYKQVQPVRSVDPDGELWIAMGETIEYPLMAFIAISVIVGEETKDIKGPKNRNSTQEAKTLLRLLRSVLAQKVKFQRNQESSKPGSRVNTKDPNKAAFWFAYIEQSLAGAVKHSFRLAIEPAPPPIAAPASNIR